MATDFILLTTDRHKKLLARLVSVVEFEIALFQTISP